MGASKFVGRVGGLAVALGVGAAAFSSSVAWADASESGSDSAGASRGNDSSSSQPASRGRKAAAQAPSATPARIAARQQRNSRSDSAPTPSAPPVSGGQSSALEVDVDPAPAAVPVPAAAAVAAPSVPAAIAVEAPPTDSPAPAAASAPAEIVAAAVPAPEPDPAPAGEVAGFLSEADYGLADGAGSNPLVPVASPLEWALLAAARRQPLSAAATAGQVASATTAQAVTTKGITVDPTVEFIDGIFRGSLNATSERGATLSYTSLGGSNGGKLDLGTVPVSPTETDPQSYTILPYATWLNAGGTKGAEQFSIRISETTDFDQFLINIPLVGLVAAPVIDLLQQLPLVSDLLAPIIGSSIVATVDVDVAADAPGDTPLAFTYDVISFDGTPISTNFFPAVGIAAGETAPVVLNGPGLGSPGETDPYNVAGTFGSVPGVYLLRDGGYNVVTWDPRGEFASGGVLQLDNPFFEGRDASAIVSWSADNPLVELNAPDDPKVGMVGGSYGGGIQMVTAATDPRIDAIVPNGNWYSLVDALYPSDTFKTAWAALLTLDLLESGARINTQIYEGVLTGTLFGFLSQTSQAVLTSSGPTSLLNQLQAPTLLVQGIVDALFPLDQSVFNAETITANPYGTPVKLAWFCGGHGACLGSTVGQQNALFGATFAWLDTYVAGSGGADAIPVFQWWDQNNVRFTSDLLPFQDGFNQAVPYSATGTGGTLGIIPVIGGSGPGDNIEFPFNIIFPTPAGNALNVALTPAAGEQIVGAPQLTFTYRGLGTADAVFAQFVDDATGLVVGNNVTAIPVTLDGREHTVSVPLNDIVYTVGAGDSMTMQIAAWSSIFANSGIGVVDITDIQVDLPLRDIPAVAVV